MEALVDEHPSDDRLHAFAEGRLAQAETEVVGDHVEQCDQCTECVSRHVVDPDSLIFDFPPVSTGQQSVTSDRPADEDEAFVYDQLELQDVIGSGGMGVVYRAWQPAIGRHVAIKHIHSTIRHGDPDSVTAVARFKREIRALGRVRHPNLVRIYTSGRHNRRAVILCNGTDRRS